MKLRMGATVRAARDAGSAPSTAARASLDETPGANETSTVAPPAHRPNLLDVAGDVDVAQNIMQARLRPIAPEDQGSQPKRALRRRAPWAGAAGVCDAPSPSGGLRL